MKQAVAGHMERNNRRTLVSGADVPSSLSGTATGQRLLTQASFSFSDLATSGDVLATRNRDDTLEFCGGEATRSRTPERLLEISKVIRPGRSTVGQSTSPCDTCPKRDDCGARCAEYLVWYYGGRQ